jgi:ADP-ribose pyrophosphatase YjhB (NUDIX family)
VNPSYLEWLRAQVGHHLIPLVYATAVIRDEAGRLLCQRRADFREAWWGLPGSLLEPGEAPGGCLRREVLEETGLHVELLGLTGVYSSLRYKVTYPNGDQVQQITLCYACRITGGELKPDGGEVVGLEFFAPSDLPPLPLWYADMVAHALEARHTRVSPYFDPPELTMVETPFPTTLSLRPVVGTAPLVWAGAAAVVRDEAGRILLQQRGDSGLWGLPAGALDAGETLAHTVIRETLEETGLRVEPLRLISVLAGYEVIYTNGDRLFPVPATFECRVVGGQMRADGDESLAVAYFDREQLPPLHPTMRSRIHQALGLERAEAL